MFMKLAGWRDEALRHFRGGVHQVREDEHGATSSGNFEIYTRIDQIFDFVDARFVKMWN